MAPSPVLISAPRRAFGTMKSPMFTNNNMPSNPTRRSTPSASPTKRPLAIFNDENVDPTHPKRVKSTLTTKSSSANNENILFSKQPSAKQEKPSRFILTDRPQPVQQKPRSALGSITTNHHRIEKNKPRVGSSLKNVVLNTSPPRRRPITSPKSARDRRVPFAVRVDPPLSVAEPIPSSIDSVIHDTTINSRQESSLNNEITASLDGTLCAHDIPDSWQFTIYEDTPEETLQNMMEHSTNTLDISDDESSRSELSELGKENIPPARLAEMLATAPENQMNVDAPASRIPQRRVRGQPLREMAPVELEEEGQEEGGKGGKVPTLEKDGFMTVTTPEKKKPIIAPRSKGAMKFTVWKDPVAGKPLGKLSDENSLPPVDNAESKGTPATLKRSDSGKKRGLSEI